MEPLCDGCGGDLDDNTQTHCSMCRWYERRLKHEAEVAELEEENRRSRLMRQFDDIGDDADDDDLP